MQEAHLFLKSLSNSCYYHFPDVHILQCICCKNPTQAECNCNPVSCGACFIQKGVDSTTGCPICETNPCCGSDDPCCGSTDNCCRETDPCACDSDAECCKNPNSCECQPNNPCCGLEGSALACCKNPNSKECECKDLTGSAYACCMDSSIVCCTDPENICCTDPNSKECVFYEPEMLGCSYTYTFPEAEYSTDCEYSVSMVLGDVEADCSVSGYNNPTEKGENLGLLNVDGCGEGKYCRLMFEDEFCSSPLTDSGASKMYGSCQFIDFSYEKCPPVGNLISVSLIEKKGCQSGQYCNLAYETKDGTSELNDSSYGTMYGVCVLLNNDSTALKPTTHLTDEYLTPVYPCQDNHYCYLAWEDVWWISQGGADEACSALGNEGVQTMYGVCLPLDSNDAVCPESE